MDKIRVVLDRVISVVKTRIYGESGYSADVTSDKELKVNWAEFLH